MSYMGNEEVVTASIDGASGARSGGTMNREQQELRIKWTDASISRLCNAIKQFPQMYDLDHPQHKDRALKKRTWVAIAKATGIVNDPRKILMFARECERKFKNLRDELIKTLKRTRARKTDRPYKHADQLAFLRLERLLDLEPTYYDGTETADHDYDNTDAMDTQGIESAYAAAQVANDNAIAAITFEDYEEPHNGPRITSVRSTYPSNRRPQATSNHGRDIQYIRSSKYEHVNETRQHGHFSSPTMVRVAKETDELEDFSNIMMKRLRRLPNECWGQAMSRLMETLYSVEENAKKCSVTSTCCQTDD